MYSERNSETLCVACVDAENSIREGPGNSFLFLVISE